MISVNNVTLKFGNNILYEDVNLKFDNSNCYGIIGSNGSGKSTFLKLLNKELDTTKGDIIIDKNARISTLKQDHFMYDDYKVIDTVIMGNKKLYDIKKERDELYTHQSLTLDEGMRLGELEGEFLNLDGYSSESDAALLLTNLGVDIKYHDKLMKDIDTKLKVKVLLAQSLFQDPDILLLDEPTNNLDIKTIAWLEEFLINYKNTVIVVSHDRYFLNKVCTHIVDIDYHKMKMYVGNYDFWYKSSQLALKQMKEANKKKEEKIKELEDFIRRFSANASKSKQATSRKKMLEKITLDEIIPSTRKYPYIDFKATKESGKEILTVKNLTKKVNGEIILNNISFTVFKGDKICFLSLDDTKITKLFEILMGLDKDYKGEVIWGKTIEKSYFPKDNSNYFNNDLAIIDWIKQFYNSNDDTILRGFLGRMLFSKDDVFKKVNVLSGGEKSRCMLSKMMLEGRNFLIFDDPTTHLDLESITSLNDGLIKTNLELLFTSHDHEFINTIANRIIDIRDDKVIDKQETYDEYLNI